MKVFFAHLLSFLFHPVFFFLVMPFFIEYRHTESKLYAFKWLIFSSAFIFFGILLVLFGFWRGIFSDFDISKREERYKFYTILLLLAFSYFIATITFKGVLFPLTIIGYGIILGIFAFEVLNYFLKASVHVAVSTAFVLSMAILFGVKAFIATFWVVPLVAWSRVKIKKHSLLEIIAGGILGIAITLLTLFLGKYLYS